MRVSVKPFVMVVLLTAVLTACVVPGPTAPTSAPAPAPVSATQPAAPATLVPPTVAAAPPASGSAVPVGVDADGNFYRGDPQAPVKLVDFSDFQ